MRIITISLCMIVKDEEKVLKRCLDSLTPIVDEIIIVDTGSTDGTREIAKLYTDKIYDFEWVQDFSAARNYSFQFATMDYIYVADADEMIDEENQKRFLLLKQALLEEIDIVQMIYSNQLEYGTTYNFDREYRPKLYKRVRSFQWVEPIHEMVRLDPIVFDSDIEVRHMPLENHAGRDFKTFLNYFGNGGRLSKRLHHMYAMELYISGSNKDFEDAIPIFEDSIEDTTRDMDEVKEAMVILEKAYRIKRLSNLFFQVITKDIGSVASAETCCELGEYYFSCEEYEEACIWFLNASKETESILNIHSSGRIPLLRLAKCYDILGEKKLARECRREAQKK